MARLLVCLFACLSIVSGFIAAPLPCSQLQHSSRTEALTMTAATKATRVNRRNAAYNKMYKSEMRTRVKRVFESLEEGDFAVSSSLLSKAFAILDKNVKRGIVHKNTAARKKSQLHLKVKALEGGAAPAAAAAE